MENHKEILGPLSIDPSDSYGVGTLTRNILHSLAFALMIGLPGVASAEQRLGTEAVGSESTDTFYNFPGTPRLAVSRNGNVVRYEGPTGYEHIGIGSFSEGYVLCYGIRNAYDTGALESGFGASTANCRGSTCTITRTTTDGLLQLTQVITKNASSDRSFGVQMTVRNLSGGTVTGITLRRQVDLDVDTGGPLGTAGFVNWFGSTERDSVTAWNPPNQSVREEHGVVLSRRAVSPASIVAIAKVTSAILDTSCNPTNIAASAPVRGDYGATIQFNIGSLAGGRSASAAVQYQRN